MKAIAWVLDRLLDLVFGGHQPVDKPKVTLEARRSRSATIQIACYVAMYVVALAMGVVVVLILLQSTLGRANVHP